MTLLIIILDNYSRIVCTSEKDHTKQLAQWLQSGYGRCETHCACRCVCVCGWVSAGSSGLVWRENEYVRNIKTTFSNYKFPFQPAAWFKECWLDVSLSKNLWNKDAVHIIRKKSCLCKLFFLFCSRWSDLLLTKATLDLLSQPSWWGRYKTCSLCGRQPLPIIQTPLFVTLRSMESCTPTPPRVVSTNIVWKEHYP